MQEFLEANQLRLILRSHEGPDARCGREDLPDMSQGFTIDHVTPAGRLLTVFSAPDYPQFQARTPGPAARHQMIMVILLRLHKVWEQMLQAPTPLSHVLGTRTSIAHARGTAAAACV